MKGGERRIGEGCLRKKREAEKERPNIEGNGTFITYIEDRYL